MKFICLLLAVQFMQSCSEKAIVKKEKNQIREFVRLVSENEFEKAQAKVELPSKSQFVFAEYNFKMMYSIFDAHLNLIYSEIEKASSKEGQIDGYLLNSNYYEILLDPILYDTSLYSDMKLFFVFDRSIKKNKITLVDLRYLQKSFITPKTDVKIRNIFDDKDTTIQQ